MADDAFVAAVPVAEALALALALPLPLPLDPLPVPNTTLSLETLKPVAEGAKVIPEPLTHNLLP